MLSLADSLSERSFVRYMGAKLIGFFFPSEVRERTKMCPINTN